MADIQSRTGCVRRSLSCAFSLVELLVVLAIITLLAALLLPMLNRAKERAKAVFCLSNLKQWGLATHVFALNNDDMLPKDGAPNGTSTLEGWYVELPRAMGLPAYHEMAWRTNAAVEPGRSVWICPANTRRSDGNLLFHYCLNRQVNLSGSGNQVRLGSVRHPERTVWLFDNGKEAAVAQQNNVHPDLHAHGAHLSFLDGHARRFRNQDYWDFVHNQGRTNNPEVRWSP